MQGNVYVYSWKGKKTREIIEKLLKFHRFQFPFKNYVIIIAKIPSLHLAFLVQFVVIFFFS